MRRLLDIGSRVTIIDGLLPGQGGNLFNVQDVKDDVELHVEDMRSADAVNRLVQGKEIIFNLASQISHVESLSDPQQDLEVNCRAHLTLLEACRLQNRDVRIVLTATRAQYGAPRYLPVDEKHPQQPTDINGIHKMAQEAYHFSYSRTWGIPICALRLTNTYGPRQPLKNPRHGFINWFVRLALEGGCLRVYGDGSQLRDLNYVDDVVNALLLAGDSSKAVGEAFNLGSGRPVSVGDLARLVVRIAGSGSIERVEFPEAEQRIEIGDYYADYSKIRDALGWEPNVSLEEGLRRTIDFFVAHKEHYDK